MSRIARGFLRPSVAILAAATAAVGTQAYVVVPVSFEDLARGAEYVVVGRVTGQQARYNEERTLILTHTTIRVEEGILGDPPSTFEISEFGGRVGSRVLSFPGQVPYRDGESILVFVCRDSANRYRTCGAHQGRLELIEAPDGTREARGQMAGEPIRDNVEKLRTRIHAAREVSR